MNMGKGFQEEGICSCFFGYLGEFIDRAYQPFAQYELCAEVYQNGAELQEICTTVNSIQELPENLQKIAYQSIPYFLKTTSIYTEDDIPY